MSDTEWTIATLKAHLEAKICAIEKLRAKDLQQFKDYADSRAKALELQAAEYERRLKDLNGEQARIAANQAQHVGREIWDRYLESDRDWKNKTEVALSQCVTTTVFQTYSKTTDQALQIAAGQSKGVSQITGVIVTLISIVIAIAAVGVALYHK